MKRQAAVHILMLSPVYFWLDLLARKNLVKDFCKNFPDSEEDRFHRTAEKLRR